MHERVVTGFRIPDRLRRRIGCGNAERADDKARRFRSAVRSRPDSRAVLQRHDIGSGGRHIQRHNPFFDRGGKRRFR